MKIELLTTILNLVEAISDLTIMELNDILEMVGLENQAIIKEIKMLKGFEKRLDKVN
jgi:hypothetical protein